MTLLKYKKYYTEVPLGRCLDGHGQDDTPIGTASTEVSLQQQFQDSGSGYGMCSASGHQLSEDSKPSYGEDSALMDNEQSSSVKKDGYDSEVHLFHRDPEEVLSF